MKKLLTQFLGLKKEIYILFAGKTVTAMGSFVWPMLTFFLTVKLGMESGTAALLIAGMTLLDLPASLWGGKITDRFPRKYVIIVFDLATFALYSLAALLPLGYHTVAIVFLAGLFQTLEAPAYDALNADFSTTEQRERAFSLSYLGYNLGFIIGAALAGILFAKNTNLAFFLNGFAIFLSTVLIFFFVDPKNAVAETEEGEKALSVYEQPIKEDTPVLTVLRDRRVVLYMVFIGCFTTIPGSTIGMLLPLQLSEVYGDFGATLYGYLNSLNGLTVILLTPLLTMALRKLTEIPKTALGMLFFVGGMVFYLFDGWIPLLFIGMFIYTAGEVVSVLGLNPYASRRVPASHRGRVGGINNLIVSLFCSLTQFLISFLLTVTDNNFTLIWTAFSVVGLLTAAACRLVLGPDRRRFPLLYETKDGTAQKD